MDHAKSSGLWQSDDYNGHQMQQTHDTTQGRHKMKLRQVKSNVTELTIGDTTIMFSYQTPVAGYDDQGAFRTDQHYSVTTTRQINQYLGKGVGRTVSQDYINSLVEVA